MSQLMNGMRLLIRLPLFVAFLLVCVASVLLVRILDLFLPTPVNRTPISRCYFATLCRLLGLQIRIRGTPTPHSALIISNHISWLDIVVLGACLPVRFLAKQEVAEWPVIGWLAQDVGTLFIRRGGGQSQQVREQIAATLEQDQRVLIFPEGTTSDGLKVLPFHGRLLQSAADAHRPIQAITLAYLRAGDADPVIPFIGDDSFHTHLLRLLRNPAARVEVFFHQPLLPIPAASNDQLANVLHQQVSRGLAELYGEPAAVEPAGAPSWLSLKQSTR